MRYMMQGGRAARKPTGLANVPGGRAMGRSVGRPAYRPGTSYHPGWGIGPRDSPVPLAQPQQAGYGRPPNWGIGRLGNPAQASQPQAGAAYPTLYSNVQPQGVYAPAQTQQAMNQALALAQQRAYGLPTAKMAGFDTSSPGLLARSTAASAEALARGYGQAENIGLQDRLANAQNILGGQTIRGADVLGQFQNLAAYDAANRQHTIAMQQQMLDATNAYNKGLLNTGLEGIGDQYWWDTYNLQKKQADLGNLGALMGAVYWM